MTTPSPNPESMGQLPQEQRRYIDASEISSLREKGLRIYEGEKGGSYVSSDQEWINDHVAKGHKEVTEQGTFGGLTPHPDHKPNVYQWEDGSHGATAPAEGIKKAKDEHGQPIIIEQHEFPNRGARSIPANAKEVHISTDPTSPVQAKWRNPTTGKIQISYSKKRAAQMDAEHLEHVRKNRTDIQQGIDTLKNMSAEELEGDETATCLALIADLGIRHGTDYSIHVDGYPTGIGAASLKKHNITFSEDGKTVFAHLDFRGKQAHPQKFSTSNPKVVKALKAHTKNKNADDFVFGTGPNSQAKKNSTMFKKLGGNKDILVKDIRTIYATDMAEKTLAEDYKSEDLSNLSKREFQKIRNAVGLKVGTALGHFKTEKGELINHGGQALKSYIDPDVFKDIQPQTDIQNAFTPDWRAKGPKDERDIDKYAETRKRKEENRIFGIKEFGGQRQPLVKTWMESLQEQGFFAPLIKDCTPSQMWFLNNGIDYVGTFGMNGHVFVEKATFKPTFNNPGISYNPSGRNKDGKTTEPRPAVESLEFDGDDSF